jgi:hypothetical protein
METNMRRHSTDLAGLLFGIAFAVAGTAFLLRETTDASVDPAWVSGLGLMFLGAIALVATLARSSRGHVDPAAAELPTMPESDD